MAMPTKGTRAIVVDDEPYRWKVGLHWDYGADLSLRIQHDSDKKRQCLVHFNGIEYALITPRVVAAVIRHLFTKENLALPTLPCLHDAATLFSEHIGQAQKNNQAQNKAAAKRHQDR